MPALPRFQILKAIDRALRCRRKAGFQPNEPVCVFDLAAKLGVEVRFVGGNSFGGMFAKDFAKILVPAKRPAGRQVFTCAHELGHWAFGHGTRIELMEELDKGSSDDPDEQMANLFSTHLVMPEYAIIDAFRRRGLSMKQVDALNCYRVANQLGVGYETLVKHLNCGLRAIDNGTAKKLLDVAPKDLRKSVLGTDEYRHMVLADHLWWRVPIDLSVGDALILPVTFSAEGSVLSKVGITFHGSWFEAKQPGICRVIEPDLGWSCYVRVARKGYIGRAKFRFLEDPDVDELS